MTKELRANSPQDGLRPHRVLFVTHEATRTGAPMFLLHLLRWLRRHTSLDFDILVAKGGPLESAFAELGKVHTPQALAANPRLLQSFALIYSNTACNGNLLEELPIGRVPVITHVHELDMGYHWLGARNMAGVMRHTSHFIACAEAVASRLRQVFSIPAERISVHYEMIDGVSVAANAVAAARSVRADFNIPEGAQVVTACGTFDIRKAPDLFVQVAAQLKRRNPARPICFLWIGALNTPDLVRMLREDVRKVGLEEQLHFVGELPSPHGLLALSDVFCLTSREDPFPLIMLEAAALGKPVLCFDGAGGAGEFCAAGGGLSVPYLDTVAMASLADDLLNDAPRRAEVGRRAAELVSKSFVVEAIAPALWQELQGRLAGLAQTASSLRQAETLTEVYAGWSIKEAPQSAYIEAHLARASVLVQAHELTAAGKPKDAVQLLVRSVSDDVAKKDPLIIFESLVMIGDALKTLEPQRSVHLLAEAERFARGNPYLKLDTFRSRSRAA